MGFALEKLWVMGYHVFMGYGSEIPAYQVGGPKNAWGLRGYGLSHLWVKRGSTVLHQAPKIALAHREADQLVGSTVVGQVQELITGSQTTNWDSHHFTP